VVVQLQRESHSSAIVQQPGDSTIDHNRPMDAKTFRALATAAFPAADPPAEVVSELAREVHADAGAMEEALMGTQWTGVPQAVLEARAKDIVALTVPAFAYYIPAFMCAGVANPEGDSATYAMYALCPLGSFDTFDRTTCALFDSQQCSVVAAFLAFLRDEPSFNLFVEEMKPGLELWKRRAV
jgi:hypothetical protein